MVQSFPIVWAREKRPARQASMGSGPNSDAPLSDSVIAAALEHAESYLTREVRLLSRARHSRVGCSVSRAQDDRQFLEKVVRVAKL